MVVELAVLIPVAVAVAAIAMNLLGYLGLCARFDRVAAEAVRVNGTSPAYGSYSRASCEHAVEEAIREAFADVSGVEVSVSSVELGAVSGAERPEAGLVFSLVPTHRRYTCTLSCDPPFFGSGAFGAVFSPLRHECEYVVDPFNPQGWL